MSYTVDILNYMTEDNEYTQAQITTGVRGLAKTRVPYRDVQKALYSMVKSGAVVWNRQMGNAGRYRLLPGATASMPPPLTGGAGAGTGDGGVDDDDVVDESSVYVALRRVRRAGGGGMRALSDAQVGWLARAGFLGLNARGKEWYEAGE